MLHTATHCYTLHALDLQDCSGSTCENLAPNTHGRRADLFQSVKTTKWHMPVGHTMRRLHLCVEHVLRYVHMYIYIHTYKQICTYTRVCIIGGVRTSVSSIYLSAHTYMYMYIQVFSWVCMLRGGRTSICRACPTFSTCAEQVWDSRFSLFGWVVSRFEPTHERKYFLKYRFSCFLNIDFPSYFCVSTMLGGRRTGWRRQKGFVFGYDWW